MFSFIVLALHQSTPSTLACIRAPYPLTENLHLGNRIIFWKNLGCEMPAKSVSRTRIDQSPSSCTSALSQVFPDWSEHIATSTPACTDSFTDSLRRSCFQWYDYSNDLLSIPPRKSLPVINAKSGKEICLSWHHSIIVYDNRQRRSGDSFLTARARFIYPRLRFDSKSYRAFKHDQAERNHHIGSAESCYSINNLFHRMENSASLHSLCQSWLWV